MDTDFLLSIDCGTQSLRAMIFSTKGELIDKEQIFYQPYYSEKPGHAEQKAETYWDSLCKATQALKSRNSVNFDKIKGIGVTTLRNTMVAMDKDGNPVRPTIVWLDQRKCDIFYKPKFPWKQIYDAIGMTFTIRNLQREGKCNWIRQFEPENWQKTHKYVQVSGFLNHKLTGTFNDSIASQIGHIPFHYKKQKWVANRSPFNLSYSIFPVEKEKLPDLLNPGGKIGEITENAAKQTGLKLGTPVIATGSDKGCETLGSGVVDNTVASLSFGTTATIQTTVSKYFEQKRYFPAYPSVVPNFWNPEIEIFRGFWMVSWFKNEFAQKEMQEAAQKGIKAEEIMERMLTETPAGAMGLIVQPKWAPGLGELNSKGAIIGFGDVHNKAYLYRAVIEGLVYGLREGKEILEKRGKTKFTKLTVSGGGSESSEICQITADIFNMNVYRSNTSETSGLGAAIITAYGLGIYKNINDACTNMIKHQNCFFPNKNNTELYDKLYNQVFLKIKDTLEPLNKKIRIIMNYPEM